MGGFGDSLSAGVKCVYTLTVVTVVGLAVEIWRGAKCEEGYGAGYVCKSVEREKSEKRLTREGSLLFHLKGVPFFGFAPVL